MKESFPQKWCIMVYPRTRIHHTYYPYYKRVTRKWCILGVKIEKKGKKEKHGESSEKDTPPYTMIHHNGDKCNKIKTIPKHIIVKNVVYPQKKRKGYTTLTQKNMFSKEFIENFTRVETAIRALDTHRTADGSVVRSDFFIRNFEQRILDEIAQLPEPLYPTAEQIEQCTRKAYTRFVRFFGWNIIPTVKERK